MDYGEIPVIKEFSSSNRTGGTVRWTWRFGLDNLVQSYRGFKVEWQGFPTTSPDLVVDGYGKSCLAGYVSWNGATNVEEWAIYEGWAHDKLSQVSRIGYQGFETEFTVDRRTVTPVANREFSIGSGGACTSPNRTRHD